MEKETSLKNFRCSFCKQEVDSSVVRHIGLVIMAQNLCKPAPSSYCEPLRPREGMEMG